MNARKINGDETLEAAFVRVELALKEAAKSAEKLWNQLGPDEIREVQEFVKVLTEQYESENEALVIKYPDKRSAIKKIIINGETYLLDGECEEIEFLLRKSGCSLITKAKNG